MLQYAGITARVQAAWNIYQKHHCVCIICVGARQKRRNLSFLSIYNLLESAFSKQIVVQIHTCSKRQKHRWNEMLVHSCYIGCKASLSSPLFLILSAWQCFKMKSTMQLVMMNEHNKILCTVNKQISVSCMNPSCDLQYVLYPNLRLPSLLFYKEASRSLAEIEAFDFAAMLEFPCLNMNNKIWCLCMHISYFWLSTGSWYQCFLDSQTRCLTHSFATTGTLCYPYDILRSVCINDDPYRRPSFKNNALLKKCVYYIKWNINIWLICIKMVSLGDKFFHD